jgi:hypothetical protein
MISFSRTIRKHMANYYLVKVQRPDRIPAGLLFRTALNRITNDRLRDSLINDEELVAIFNVSKSFIEDGGNRSYIRVYCLIRGKDNLSIVIAFPITSSITMVTRSSIDRNDLLQLANVSVPLFRSSFCTPKNFSPEKTKMKRLNPLSSIFEAYISFGGYKK